MGAADLSAAGTGAGEDGWSDASLASGPDLGCGFKCFDALEGAGSASMR